MKANSEKARDPYDGLRLWSAITHGIGVVLAVVGTVWLLGSAAMFGMMATVIL